MGGDGGSEGMCGVDECMEWPGGGGGVGGKESFGAWEVLAQEGRKGSGCTPLHAVARTPCSSFWQELLWGCAAATCRTPCWPSAPCSSPACSSWSSSGPPAAWSRTRGLGGWPSACSGDPSQDVTLSKYERARWHDLPRRRSERYCWSAPGESRLYIDSTNHLTVSRLYWMRESKAFFDFRFFKVFFWKSIPCKKKPPCKCFSYAGNNVTLNTGLAWRDTDAGARI